ncbi:hypothetical protein BJ165DRAFT_1535565 [Panaeolus papilionaceus]|nr:hypothetical protein BJ165DRAFT_1535565 [Panaeolus papilionaceus]
MTRAPWTTKEQRTFLKQHLIKWRVGDSKKHILLFDTLVKEWIERWPAGYTPPSEADIESYIDINTPHSLAEAMAREVAVTPIAKRLRQWLNNYTNRLTESDLEESDDSRPSKKTKKTKHTNNKNKSASTPKAELILGAKRLLQTWQVFWNRHQETLQTLVNAAWKEEHQGKDCKKTPENGWITFSSKVARKLTTGYEVMDETIQERNQRLTMIDHGSTSCIAQLPTALDNVSASIYGQTEWSGMMIFGGPRPSLGGKRQIVVSFGGRTQNLKEWMGKEKFAKAIHQVFSDYMLDTYGDGEALEKWSLDYEPPSCSESECEDSESNDGGNANDGTLVIRGGAHVVLSEKESPYDVATTSSSSSPPSRAVTALEIIKNVLTTSLHDTTTPTIDSTKSAADHNDQAAQDPNADTLPHPTNNSQGHSVEGAVVEERNDKGIIVETTNREEEVDDLSMVAGLPQLPLNVVDEAATNSVGVDDEDQLDKCSAPQRTREQMDKDHDADADVIMAQEETPPLRDQDETTAIHTPPTMSKPATSSPTVSSMTSPTQPDASNNSAATSVSTPCITPATPSPSSSVSINAPSADPITTTAPVGTQAAWDVVRNASQDPQWHSFVNAFFRFETQEPITGQLSVGLMMRPKMVTEWIRSKKKHSIPDISFNLAATQMVTWWKALCPNPNDATIFPSFAKGGTSGIYTVVVPLAWCVSLINDSADITIQEELWQTIGTLGRILAFFAAESKKPQCASKRSVASVDVASKEDGGRKRFQVEETLNDVDTML